MWEKHGLVGEPQEGSEKRESLERVQFRKPVFELAELVDSRSVGTWPLHNKIGAGVAGALRMFSSKHIVKWLLKSQYLAGKEMFVVTVNSSSCEGAWMRFTGAEYSALTKVRAVCVLCEHLKMTFSLR